tara:strand:- start:221 stop:361 length:141 start_codon:yes stop_codon:yes gene_type:complete
MTPKCVGLVVGFNKKSEGGKQFVHVLSDGQVILYLFFDVEVIRENI